MTLRQNMLAAKAGIKSKAPQIHEVKIEEDVKDFDEALDEISQKIEALTNIAPPSKVDGLQQVCDQINSLKHAKGESVMDSDDEMGAKDHDESEEAHGLGSEDQE